MVKFLYVKWALVSITSRKGLVPCLRQSIYLNNADHILRSNFLSNTFPNSNLILLYFSQWKVLNWENMRLKVLIIWSLMNRHYVNKWFSSLKQCQLRPIVRVETHKICLASSERLWWWRNKRLFLVFFCLFFSYHTIQHYLTSVCHYNA